MRGHAKLADDFQPAAGDAADPCVRLSVVIPAYNEASAIGEVVREVQSALSDWDGPWELTVVDDGSTDGTARAAEQAGALVVSRPENCGYGAAVKYGIRLARGEWVALLDGDGSYDPEALPLLLAFLPDYDQVNGRRVCERGKWSMLRRLAKGTIRAVAQWISGKRIPDLNTGMKVFKRSAALNHLWALPDGFSASTSLTLAFLCDGRLVKYVDVPYRERTGASKFRPLRDTLQYLATLLRVMLYFRPLRVFLPLALAMYAVAIPKAIGDIILSPRGLHDADVVLLSLATVTGLFGLLAELIVAQRRCSHGETGARSP